MNTLDKLKLIGIAIVVILCAYTVFGVGTRVDEIKYRAPEEIKKRGWKILRYEGYQWGAWHNHGGKVWFHVQDTLNTNVQYRVFITKWGGELHYTYGAPEKLQRIELNSL